MKEARVQEQPGAAQARPAKGTEAGEARRRPPYLRTLPAALIRFSRFQKKKRAKPPILKKPPEPQPNDSLEGTCGLGCIVIRCCQRFNNVRCFLFVYCTLTICQGMIFGLVDVSIANFQKDYYLKIIEESVLQSSYDISSCLIAIFVAYYGGRAKRTTWMAVSSFLIGVGSLFFAFPFFNNRSYEMKTEIEGICQESMAFKTCQKSTLSFQSKYVSFFILGQTVQGIAGMPIYILGLTYIDDSVTTHSAGTYLGLAEASGVVGYALGYVIGAPFLKASENSTSEKNTEDDGYPQWLSTWWIYFLITTLIAWSTSIPLSCFPTNIPGTARMKAGKRKQPHLFDSMLKDQKFGSGIKDLFAAIRVLSNNQVFVCLAMSKATEYLVIVGASEVLPKYIENQFMLTPNMATALAGLVLIHGGGLGQLLGGVIVSQLELSCEGLMKFIIFTSIVPLILLWFIIFVRCDPAIFAGINENYDGTGQLGNLTAPCNEKCKCSSSLYSSICGRDDIEYFSPCFAGCKHSKTLHGQKVYYNCSCIKEGLITTDDQGDSIDARPGKCDTKCYKLPLFIAFIFSILVFSGFSAVPITLAIFRITPDKLHSLAYGVAFVILRIFGSIPGPYIFKKAGETSCTFRDTEECGHKGHCWIYNKTIMAYILIGLLELPGSFGEIKPKTWLRCDVNGGGEGRELDFVSREDDSFHVSTQGELSPTDSHISVCPQSLKSAAGWRPRGARPGPGRGGLCLGWQAASPRPLTWLPPGRKPSRAFRFAQAATGVAQLSANHPPAGPGAGAPGSGAREEGPGCSAGGGESARGGRTERWKSVLTGALSPARGGEPERNLAFCYSRRHWSRENPS
ncbi:solute carrier organic anion transporter family member 6A1 [Cynocephalus volans]|uniref:solute carrier organic anion transporter family member 6A1 n=1 Tax=Cynocephalus volans TaxID=110931 RepID=UPI002FC7D89B